MDLEADDGLIFRQDFRREGSGLWSGFRHKETRIIALPRRASGGVEAVTGVSADGLARSHGEIGRQLIEAEPADFARFSRLAVHGFA